MFIVGIGSAEGGQARVACLWQDLSGKYNIGNLKL